jgi:hypothetical protein
MERCSGLVVAAAFLAATMTATAARADGKATSAASAEEKQTCIAATDKGQQAKLEGRLRVAREQFLICSRSECPALVRQDCAQWVTEVIAALPTVVVGARDWQGHDVLGVKVSVDGVVAQESLDGKPIFVDPGVHTFRYESAGAQAPVEEKVLIREGEKNRSLTVQFPPPAGAATPPPNPPATDRSGAGGAGGPPTGGPTRAGPSPLAYLFTGIGVVALGGALALDLWGNSEVNADQKPTSEGGCKPNCNVSPIYAKWYGAGAALGVGIVSLGVATYFFIARPSSSGGTDANHAGLSIDFAPTVHGGLGQIVGRF